MLIICCLSIVGIAILDLWIKSRVEKKIKRGEEIPVCRGKILLRHVHNEGMALNMLDRYPKAVKWISIVMTGLVAVYALCLFGKHKNGLEKISLSFLIGGAVSNLYDRIKRKYVVDYIGFKTKWKKLTDITFNIGDFSIFAGAIGFILSGFKK